MGQTRNLTKRMIILFISRWFPYPADNGSKLRIFNLLKGLASVHDVHLVSFSDDPANENVDVLLELCVSVETVPWHDFQPDSIKSLFGFFNPNPRSLVDTYSPEMAIKISRTISSKSIDLVITTQWGMTAYRSLFQGIPTLFEEIEVGIPYGKYRDTSSILAKLRLGLSWWKLRKYLQRVLGNDTYCTVVSEKERSLLASIAPQSSITVIPNGVTLQKNNQINEMPLLNTLIFTGSFRYQPNHEAMAWFTEKVFPIIQKQIPDAKLTITGDPAGIDLSHIPGVVQTGFVDEISLLITRAWCSVVPLLVGGGTRLKILEAMALGTPVVSTSKGAEGLDGIDNVHLLIADTPEDFAMKTIKLLRNQSLRKRLSENARRLVFEKYDWQVITPIFLELVQAVVKVREYNSKRAKL
jgi:glycosyltransferase involved in cell wall biosynthesis